MARPATEHATPRPTSVSDDSSSAVDDLVAVLRATRFYEWPQMRHGLAGAMRAAFDQAAEIVRAEWGPEERLLQMQAALAEVAARAAVARVTVDTTPTDGADTVEHVRRAGDALQAAQELIALGSAA